MSLGKWTFANTCVMGKNRIVLDTNSLVQCIAPHSRYRKNFSVLSKIDFPKIVVVGIDTFLRSL